MALFLCLALVAFLGRRMYYKIQAQKNQRWEFTATLLLNREMNEEEMVILLKNYNDKIDEDEVLRPVVDDLGLTELWGLPSDGDTIEMMRQYSGFRRGDDLKSVFFYVSDKDKDLAGKLATRIGEQFDSYLRRERFDIPEPPPPPPDAF